MHPKKTDTIQSIPQHNSDENLRQKIENKWYLAVAKSIINKLLTWTNTGLTLKGYYVKA